MDHGLVAHEIPALWGVPLLPAEKLWLFALVLSRISGLVTSAPFFSALHIPIRLRALLTVAIALVIFPSQWHVPLPQGESLPEIAVLLGSQWLVGMALGLSAAVVLGALYLSGEIIARTAGLMLADIFDPLNDSEASPVAQLTGWIAAAIFFVSGAYRWLVDAILASFVFLPLTETVNVSHFWPALIFVVSHSLASGLQLGAPVLLLLITGTLVLGFVGRTLPQLNILAVGLGLNGLLALIGLSLALGGMIWTFTEQLEWWRERSLVDLLLGQP